MNLDRLDHRLDKLDHRDVHTYALGLGDDALILAQRIGHWIARAPQIEEDVALGNIGLDLLGQARLLLTYAGEATGQSEDDLAYLREEREFTNLQIVEHPNEDFAVTIARQLVFSTYQLGLYERLQRSTDETLAAIAAKAVKEVDYHRDPASGWTVRLGDGTEESHGRMQAALDHLWPFTHELFELDEGIRAEWDDHIDGVLKEATLERPTDGWKPTGGRRGIHTDHLGYVLAEMQHLHRSHPGAKW
jgi:ring-1,2-phenylacetyl-CoA epoxidase subunit PaaC